MRLQDAEGAKLVALTHYRLDYRDFVKLLARELLYFLDKFVLGDVREAVFTVLAEAAILSEDTRVRQALEYAISEAGVPHVVEAWQHIHLRQLLVVLFHTGASGAGARANLTHVAGQLEVLNLGYVLNGSSVMLLLAISVLAGGVDQLLNFLFRNDIVPLACWSENIIIFHLTATPRFFLSLL